ncbi:MAG: hypothetical protein D6820_02975, partial [Lentisphaerae bacterium]
RPGCPLNIKDARRVVAHDVNQYSNHRLHSAIGYVTPRDMLEQRAEEILRERERKLEQAREHRRQRHQNNRRTHSVLRTESHNTNSSKPAESQVSRRISAYRAEAEGEVMPSGDLTKAGRRATKKEQGKHHAYPLKTQQEYSYSR